MRTFSRSIALASLIATAAPLAVSADDKPAPAAPAPAAAITPLVVGEFSFSPAAPWQVAPTPRPMSAGGFVLPQKEGQPLDAAFYHFPGQGGDVEANVTRWKGQFKPSPEPTLKREEIKFGDRSVTLLQIHGTFVGASFRPEAEPREGWTMLAAICQSEKGHVFVRMTGPKAAIEAGTAEFKKLLASAYPAAAK
jgi:hypothetical protein